MRSMTNETNKKFLEDIANETLTGLINFLCSKYDSINKCRQLMPNPMKQLKAVFKNPGPKEKFESYLMPFLDILSD